MFDVNPLASVLTGDESNIAPSVAAVNDALATKADSVHDHDADYDHDGEAAAAQAHAVQRSNHTGEQAISTVTGLQASLDSKSASTHNHDTEYDSIGAAASAQAAAVQRLNHTGSQAISTVTGLQAALDAKAASVHSHDDAYDSLGTAEAYYALAVQRSSHTGTQAQSTVVNLVSDLAGKASTTHDHDADYEPLGTAASAISALGLGTAATYDVPASGNAASGEVVLGSDSRLGTADFLAQFPLAGTGSVYASIAGAGVNNFTLGRSVEYATGIYIPADLYVTTIRMVLQVTSAGTVARFAIKPINPGGKPGNPVWTSGECDFAVTGEKDTAVGVTLAPGWYALCCAFFNGSANPQFLAGNLAGSYPVWGRSLAAAGGQPINMIYRSGATNAALPDTSASTWVNNPGANVHIIGLF